MAELLALMAACAFALGSVLQQKGTMQTSAGEGDARFLVEILHRPVWLIGGLAQAAGWTLQAAALDRGSLVVVQSLCCLSLVIAVPLGIRLTDQVATRAVWLGAGLVTAGIIVMLSGGAPQKGTSTPDAAAWWAAAVLVVVPAVLLPMRGRSRHGAVRALHFGTAAGLCFAFQAAVTKVFVPILDHGLHAVITSWTVYALIASAVGGFVLQQSALKTGVLAPAVASSNAVTLLGSIVLGILVFGESLSRGDNRAAPALAGLAMVVAGMALLARSGPEVRSDQPGTSRSGTC